MKTGKEYLLDKIGGNKTGEYDQKKLEVITYWMDEYAKYYHEQQVNSVDLADVGGSLRELADKYEIDALERYETGDHALSHLHMAAQARYGFEDGWKAAKKQ